MVRRPRKSPRLAFILGVLVLFAETVKLVLCPVALIQLSVAKEPTIKPSPTRVRISVRITNSFWRSSSAIVKSNAGLLVLRDVESVYNTHFSPRPRFLCLSKMICGVKSPVYPFTVIISISVQRTTKVIDKCESITSSGHASELARDREGLWQNIFKREIISWN